MKKIKFNEDWTATIIGLIIIIFAVALLSPSFSGMVIQWPKFSWDSWQTLQENVFSGINLLRIVGVFVAFMVLVFLAGLFANKPISSMMKVYPVIFLLTLFASIVSGNKVMKEWGLETVIFCLLLGLVISNCFKIPTWIKDSLTSELFIKIGLVILGTTILFQSMMKAGVYGLIQAVVVIFTVWNVCFWICKKMKIDRELSVMLSSAVSICGVSAAIATAGAIKGDKAKLSYVVSLVLIVAVPMILLLPAIAHLFGFSETLAGAWFGGTIDTTGAVVASGEFYGEEALKISTIVKSSQNVLLGIAAFAISVYWSVTGQGSREEKPSGKVIWERFPKFVLGFILASLIFSFCFSEPTVAATKVILKSVQGFWFALAFTSIGLETNFKALINQQNRKATGAFLLAQTFNIFFTLLIAWLLFEVIGNGLQV
ncbi:MAG: putative sulfate exporter family transporter [Bacteroidales bacterium]|nr:putative sulfate exporter family transporter [Bacteroidales bacterium]